MTFTPNLSRSNFGRMGGNNIIASGLSTLAGILEREKSRGVGTIALSPDAERLLRAFPAEFMSAGRREADVTTPVAGASGAAKESSSETSPALPQPAAAQRIPIPHVPESDRTEAWVREQLNTIFKAAKNCPDCRSLGTLFETLVFARGNPMADIVFVGEAPGIEEEEAKGPFVGPIGQKLDQILKAMGTSREEVYLSNLVKFRPRKGDGRFQGSTERPPQEEEMAASLPYFRAEIEVVRPRAIVVFGGTAAEGLLERGGTLAGFRNGAHLFEGIPVVVTYHPSHLLRAESETGAEAGNMKRLFWEDMLKVMDLVGMPVTAKQRGYFS